MMKVTFNSRKQIRRELFEVKNDLINNTLNSDQKYHQWINEKRRELLPENYNRSYYYDINGSPQKYLKYMFNINKELEKLEGKQIQFFPLRTNIYPKYIPLDTKALIDLFIKNKRKYLNSIEFYKEDVWRSIFYFKP